MAKSHRDQLRANDVALTLYKAGYVRCSHCHQLSTYEYAPTLRREPLFPRLHAWLGRA